MEIHDMLTTRTVAVGVRASTKEELLDAVLQLIADHPDVLDFEQVRQAVWAREKTMSTGVGKNLALPHAKTAAVSATVVALAVAETPVDFGSLDNEPVQLVFLLVGTPDARSSHVKILSRVSRLMNRDALRVKLLKAASVEDLLEAFREGENKLVEG